MIMYFTGSGNSKYIADILAESLDDKMISMNEILKNGGHRDFTSDRPFVIVSPIYAWRIPRRIEQLIRDSGFSGSKSVYFVVTMGSQSGNSDRYCKRICDEKGLEFRGLCGVQMPDNYFIGYKLMTKEESERTISDAIPKARAIADVIRSGGMLVKDDKTPIAFSKSGFVNSMFVHFSKKQRFSVSRRCSSCGRCVKQCPVNNIVMVDKIPRFGNNCMSCYACVHRCPAKAIDIKGKADKNGRYVCPEYKKVE